MNSKKANGIFLAIVLTHIVVVILGIVLPGMMNMNMITNLILSQLIVLIPAFSGVLLSGEKISVLLEFHKIKISSTFMIVLFTFLMIPLITLVNAISMLFVENTVGAMSEGIVAVPFSVMVLFIGLIGPICEELVFRGLFYNSYKKSGTAFGALILSAVLFGFMHMNFNQAAYAIIIGIILVLLNEAAGSIIASIIFHVVFNSQQVFLMYFMEKVSPGSASEASAQLDRQMLFAGIGVYVVIASITTALAVGVLAWIAKNEKREGNLRAVWTSRKTKSKERMVTLPLIIAIVLCLFYMIVMTVLTGVQ